MERILVVEDDLALSTGLCFELDQTGYVTQAAYNCKKARYLTSKEDFELVILDVNLPDGSGFELCREIKNANPEIPVIFLTANDLDEDVLRGFDLGAEDYITKPFSVIALQHKISAMLAMVENHKPFEDIYDDGKLCLDFARQTGTIAGKQLMLSAMEYRMLALFCRSAGQVLTRRLLLERLWDAEEKYVDEHTLTTTVSRIRGKIEAEGDTYIKTIYGMGYQWMGSERAWK